MKIIFLTSYAVSHIIPIKRIIRELNNHNCSVLCMVNKANIEYCKKNNIDYITYPDNYWKKKHRDKAQQIDEEIKMYENQYDFQKMYDAFLKKDAIGIYNYFEDVSEYIEKVIDQYQPDIVFRDSTDIYWMRLKRKIKYNKIKTIGYITNNLYSWNYLMNSVNNILPNFLGIMNFLPLVSQEYLNNFKDNLTNIYKQVSSDLNEEYIAPFYQYDPNENLNIIFSQKTFQPILDNSKNSLIYPPSKTDFVIEADVDEDIKKICEQNSIIYISTGSFMSREINYYKEIIDILNNHLKPDSYKIIISGGKATDEILKMVEISNINLEIIIKRKIPQLFVLSHSDLFITSGGMNSIKEAIYFKVPMVVFPISSEQRLNGMIIENLGIGFTTYKLPSAIISFENNIDAILGMNFKNVFKKFENDYDIELDFIKNLVDGNQSINL